MQTTKNLRQRMRRNLSNAAIIATDMILFASAPHVHPVPSAISIDRQISRARAIINKIGAVSEANYNPYKGINIS